jgi:hypothetical protein
MTMTDAGREWAKGGDPVPEDSTGYLATFDKLVPSVDPVIRQYVPEALVVYEHRASFAAAVMIGAASEATIYLLADALLAALTRGTEKTNLERAVRRHEIAEILKRISGASDRAKEPSGSMPYAVSEGAEHYPARASRCDPRSAKRSRAPDRRQGEARRGPARAIGVPGGVPEGLRSRGLVPREQGLRERKDGGSGPPACAFRARQRRSGRSGRCRTSTCRPAALSRREHSVRVEELDPLKRVRLSNFALALRTTTPKMQPR